MSRKHNRQKNRNRVILVPGGTRATALATSVPPASATQQPVDAIFPAIQQPAPLMGGRQTQPYNVNPLGLLAYSFLPRRQYQDIDLTQAISQQFFTAQQLLEVLADVEPNTSEATSNMVRLVNGGYKFTVTTKNGTKELKQGKSILDALLTRINKDGGGLNALIDSWTGTAFLQGAVTGEIALTETLDDVQDIYAVQPWTIWFMRDGLQSLVPFQQQVQTASVNVQNQLPASSNPPPNGFGIAGYPYRRLNPTTFGYLPIDAFPDDPYGRPPAAPILQLIVFYFQLVKDLRQWVHTSAWGRIQVQMSEEAVMVNAPPSAKNDPSHLEQIKYINARLAAFKSAYGQIRPDDAFFTTDAIKLNAVDQSGKTFQGIGPLFDWLNACMFRALKQHPVMMGSNEGTTETHGTVQMAIVGAFIKSFQTKIANLIEKFLNVALQVYGVNGVAHFEFEPVRIVDKVLEIQAEQAESELVAYQRDQGWITQDAASIRITGSPAVSDPKPAPKPQTPIQASNPNGDESGATKDETDTTDANSKDDGKSNGKPDAKSGKAGKDPDDKEIDDAQAAA